MRQFDPSDVSNDTIETLFQRQVRRLTAHTEGNSFDFQFSDRWL